MKAGKGGGEEGQRPETQRKGRVSPIRGEPRTLAQALAKNHGRAGTLPGPYKTGRYE